MESKMQVILPKYRAMLVVVGENIKLARKRRQLTATQVSERAGIERSTLSLIENGKGNVSILAYVNVLRVLHLENDLLKIAAKDELGRKMQDIHLLKGKKPGK